MKVFVAALVAAVVAFASAKQLVPVGGAQKDTWTAAWTYSDLYDGSESTSVWDNGCYHSGSKSNAWVEVDFDDSYLFTSVSILNRGDCCWDRAMDMKIKVCEDGECVDCGVVSSDGKGAWIETKCDKGAFGSKVRFEHDNQYIQICEAKFEGVALNNGFARWAVFELGFPFEYAKFLPSVDRLIPVGGAQKNTWNAAWTYEDLYDGTESTSVWDNGCYHSAGKSNEWVEVYLDGLSVVAAVSILNRGDCCEARAIGMKINVCQGEDCQLCGTVSSGEKGAWLTVDCDGPIAGNIVRFSHQSDYIQICEADIRGFQLLEEEGVVPWWLAILAPKFAERMTEAKSIVPVSGADNGAWTGRADWHYDKLYDGTTSTSVWNNGCYHSQYESNPWAELNLDDDYLIKSVSLLNRGDCCPDRAIGTKIEVCDGGDCAECGVNQDGSSGAWLEVVCAEGLIGNKIRISHTNKYLQICEVDIKGGKPFQAEPMPWFLPLVLKAVGLDLKQLQLGGEPQKLIPIDGAHSGTWSGRSDWGYDKLYDGGESTSVWDNQCFHSAGTSDPWVAVQLDDTYTISEVAVLNREDCCSDRAKGMEVSVCNEDLDCALCGTITQADVDNGPWMNVECESRVQGEIVLFTLAGNYIQICEVNIKGFKGAPLLPFFVPLLYAKYSGRPAESIVPIGGSDSGTWSNRADWHYDKMYDGTVSTSVWDNGCFHSAQQSGAWAELELDDRYVIESVSMLNRGDCCADRAIGMNIFVCSNNDCVKCGSVASGNSGAWLLTKCADKPRGNKIRFEHNKYIQICEVDIKGYAVFDLDRLLN